MSRNNKVNPDHYTMAGRLSADDLARERMRQGEPQLGGGRRGRKKAMPPWMANERQQGETEREGEDEARRDNAEQTAAAANQRDRAEGAGMPRRKAALKRGAAASRKGKRPTPRRKATGEPPAKIARKSPKAAGARGTPKTRKAPSAHGTAARGASPQRAGRSSARTGRTKGAGTTRKAQKKGSAKSSKKAATRTKAKAKAKAKAQTARKR